ncbi:hypothetical protein K2173_016031 [Erythroxylum novogranatense]|uniref:Protein FLX-like 2 n=1 Tax=Erythroxylum novogranatense TaxID=1862640 RepID=A0AAV8SF95_9ROSI|nr:hypothetical protein K2173_016031 [Erythroxylum novogranatense]
MATRGHIPSTVERRVVHAPTVIQRGSSPPLDRLENKIAVQAAEIEQLDLDNRRLVDSQVALKQDLVATQQEAQRLRTHIRSIQNESDAQIMILRDKIAKMESDMRVGEHVKNELKQAHMEAQSLFKEREALAVQLLQAPQLLKKLHTDIRSLPDLLAERDNVKREYKRLRAIFEHEKGTNIEMVQQMQAMEQDLIGMAREVEKLNAEVMNAETRGRAPNAYGSSYAGADHSCTPHVHSGSNYADAYGRPPVQMDAGRPVEVPYTAANTTTANTVAASGSVVGVALSNNGDNSAVGEPFEPGSNQQT